MGRKFVNLEEMQERLSHVHRRCLFDCPIAYHPVTDLVMYDIYHDLYKQIAAPPSLRVRRCWIGVNIALVRRTISHASNRISN